MTPDEKLNRVILERMRDTWNWERAGKAQRHLSKCPDVQTRDASGEDGAYGCTTGCDYMSLSPLIFCPHVPKGREFEYGEFGRLYDLFEDMDRA